MWLCLSTGEKLTINYLLFHVFKLSMLEMIRLWFIALDFVAEKSKQINSTGRKFKQIQTIEYYMCVCGKFSRNVIVTAIKSIWVISLCCCCCCCCCLENNDFVDQQMLNQEKNATKMFNLRPYCVMSSNVYFSPFKFQTSQRCRVDCRHIVTHSLSLCCCSELRTHFNNSIFILRIWRK